jgi:hypothetical protein
MHDHRQQTNNMLIIAATLVAAGILWFLAVNFKQPAPIVPPAPADYTYTNDAYGLSLQYGPHFSVLNPVETKAQPWRMESATPGERLITLILPGSTQPKTNLSDVRITIGASSDPVAVKGCLVPDQGEVQVDDAVPEPGMMHFHSTGAAAGNLYDVNSYRAMRDVNCIALESIVHSTNIGNYDPAQGITAFDATKVKETVDRVIETFRFIP